MEEFKKLLGAKKKIDPTEKEAKLNAIGGMKKMAGDMMADEMKGMQKVTVAAPDKSSLEMGLDKAKDVLNHDPMSESDDESTEDPAEEKAESPHEEKMEDALESCETPEQIDELMAKLAEKKAALKMG